ncbi:MAG: PAS domain S-box protein [Candidatus Omnitrophica bacterium]|nr:PAS domain S-box protein [Candidatus Omnitrophota bacterium]
MKRRLSLKILFWFSLFIVAIVLVNLAFIYQLQRIDKPLKEELAKDIQNIKENEQLHHLAELIRYYDEVLTQSARNYAFTGNLEWKERYQGIEPKLDKAIKEAISEGSKEDKQFFKTVNQANEVLVNLEHQALDLVGQGNQDQAITILESEKYRTNKKQYYSGFSKYLQRMMSEHEMAITFSSKDLRETINILDQITKQNYYFFIASLAFILLVSLLFGLFLRFNISKPLTRLVDLIKASGKKGGRQDLANKSSDLMKRKDEIGELATTYNQMWQDLEKTTVSKEKLKKSELRFKTLFESSRDAIMTLDPDQDRFNDANQATLEMFQIKNKEDLFSLSPADLSPLKQPDGSTSEKRSKDMINKAKKAGSCIFDWVHQRTDGTTFPARIRLTRMRINEKITVQAIVRDISQQKEAENQLKERVKEFGCLSNLAKIVEEPNISFEGILAKTVEIIPPALQYPDIASARLTYKNNKYKTKNFKKSNCKLTSDIYLKNNKVGSIEVYYQAGVKGGKDCPFLDEEEVLVRLIAERLGGIVERKETEKLLQEAKEKFSTLVDNIPGVIYRCANDPEWTMNYISDEIEGLSGYPADDFIDNKVRTYESIIYKNDKNLVSEVIQKAVEKRNPYEIEYRIVDRNKNIKWIKERGQGVFDESGELAWLDGAIFDITLEKKAEEELKKTIKLKSDFLSTVSHELRTPLAAIKEGINIVYDQSAGEINKEQKEFLNISKRNVDRLARLINDVLDIQKLYSGKMEFNFKKNNINTIIKEVFETMKPHLERKEVKLKLDLDNDIPKLKIDYDKITQVLTNLLNNAIKFTDKGEIVVKSFLEKNLAKVSVEDTGPGIKKNDIPKLFKTFQQLQAGGGRKTGGTGLGLAICKDIISRHRGKIWVESKKSKGAKFIFVLPIKERRS